MSEKRGMTFAEFWPHYVLAHQHPVTRAFHFVSTLAEFLLLIVFVLTRQWRWLILTPLVSYGLAWFSHFFIEHNRPATWNHPVFSWLADHRMFALTLVGQMGAEVERSRRLADRLEHPQSHAD